VSRPTLRIVPDHVLDRITDARAVIEGWDA